MPHKDQFDREGHTYWRDGAWVPSCTQILDSYFPIEAPYNKVKHAALRGTLVHKKIEELEQGVTPEWKETPLELEAQPRFEAWRKFRREVKVEAIQCEYWRIGEVNGFVYGVTPDFVCKVEGLRAVIECKNTYREEAAHPIQTAAQVEAVHENFEEYTNEWKRYGLYLKDNGNYQLKEHVRLSDFDDWEALLRAYHTARRIRLTK